MVQQPPVGRLLAIGDIHGCLSALDALLAAIDIRPEDTLVTMGDYVDRGEHSKGVIDRLLELRDRCHLVTLRGNHEEMMADVVLYGAAPQSWLRYGGVDTLDSYGFCGDLNVIPQSHRDFLENLRDYYETDEAFFVHANYEADVPLERQEPDVLRWLSLQQEVPGPHRSGKKAVLGHTAARDGEIFDLGHLICIDTFIYGGGWLTALDVRTGKTWQADIDGRLRYT